MAQARSESEIPHMLRSLSPRAPFTPDTRAPVAHTAAEIPTESWSTVAPAAPRGSACHRAKTLPRTPSSSAAGRAAPLPLPPAAALAPLAPAPPPGGSGGRGSRSRHRRQTGRGRGQSLRPKGGLGVGSVAEPDLLGGQGWAERGRGRGRAGGAVVRAGAVAAGQGRCGSEGGSGRG